MYSLLDYNTFHIDTTTQFLEVIDETTNIADCISKYDQAPILVIGGGSNMLLIHDRNGLVILNRIMGRSVIHSNDTSITLALGAGENRHDIVMWTVSQGRRGLENLALIPGTVGASPIQNIGAYGAEAANVIESVEYFDINSGLYHNLRHDQCQFGYRDSIFKKDLKGSIIITSVVITLSKIATPILNYTGLDKLKDNADLTPMRVADTVTQIRSSKMPDWTKVGTAGSFFKNPIVDTITRDRICTLYTGCPTRAISDTHYKLAAGWLLDHVLGLKGAKSDDEKVGCRDGQALVLVNYSDATGQQVWDRAESIIYHCEQKIGIILEAEVNII